jgi:hypothetical protein
VEEQSRELASLQQQLDRLNHLLQAAQGDRTRLLASLQSQLANGSASTPVGPAAATRPIASVPRAAPQTPSAASLRPTAVSATASPLPTPLHSSAESLLATPASTAKLSSVPIGTPGGRALGSLEEYKARLRELDERLARQMEALRGASQTYS